MVSYTQHYQLHQWASTDDFLRTDFNEDLEKIDTALGGKPEIVTGAYSGNGNETQDIALGFQPLALIVISQSGMTNTTYHCYGGLALPGTPCYFNNLNAIELTSTGFRARYRDFSGTSVSTNKSNTLYFYLAFR